MPFLISMGGTASILKVVIVTNICANFVFMLCLMWFWSGPLPLWILNNQKAAKAYQQSKNLQVLIFVSRFATRFRLFCLVYSSIFFLSSHPFFFHLACVDSRGHIVCRVYEDVTLDKLLKMFMTSPSHLLIVHKRPLSMKGKGGGISGTTIADGSTAVVGLITLEVFLGQYRLMQSIFPPSQLHQIHNKSGP